MWKIKTTKYQKFSSSTLVKIDTIFVAEFNYEKNIILPKALYWLKVTWKVSHFWRNSPISDRLEIISTIFSDNKSSSSWERIRTLALKSPNLEAVIGQWNQRLPICGPGIKCWPSREHGSAFTRWENITNLLSVFYRRQCKLFNKIFAYLQLGKFFIRNSFCNYSKCSTKQSICKLFGTTSFAIKIFIKLWCAHFWQQ